MEKNRRISIEVFRPGTQDLLGFVRFEYNKDGLSVGGLKMANLKASLEFHTLSTGGTTKARDSGQTGQHGEGMKLSALVFRRCGYNFRIESNEFKWSFVYWKGELACGLTKMSDSTLEKLKQKAKGKPRTMVAHPWEDVYVIIGTSGSSRTSNGDKALGARIAVAEFKQWLKVTLDINPPDNIIRTSEGDFIRDPVYQGSMYFRGWLLPSGGTSGHSYEKGYNFKNGGTTRDHDSLAGSGEESIRIAAIWAAAIREVTPKTQTS
jgi:hypothetical protein